MINNVKTVPLMSIGLGGVSDSAAAEVCDEFECVSNVGSISITGK